MEMLLVQFEFHKIHYQTLLQLFHKYLDHPKFEMSQYLFLKNFNFDYFTSIRFHEDTKKYFKLIRACKYLNRHHLHKAKFNLELRNEESTGQQTYLI